MSASLLSPDPAADYSSLLDSRVLKEFPGHGWFEGTIVRAPSQSNEWFRIRYDDNDEEDVSFEEAIELVQAMTRKTSGTMGGPAILQQQVVSNSGATVKSDKMVDILDDRPQKRQAGSASDSNGATKATKLNSGKTTRRPSSKKPLRDHQENTDTLNSSDDLQAKKSISTDGEVVSRSGRRVKPTVVYINGRAVKKANNYRLKRFRYEYNQDSVDSMPPARNQQPRKPSQPKKPRPVSAAEIQRTTMRDAINQRVQDKLPARQAFLKANLSALFPFIDEKVAKTIQSAPDSVQLPAKSILYQQPDDISKTTSLRSYQLEGLNWMFNMYLCNMSMILGDEMGLGKTLQTIALICQIRQHVGAKETGPSLVVCPLAVLQTWCDEVQNRAPALSVLRFHNSVTDDLDTSLLVKYDLVVTTYEMVASNKLKHQWSRQNFSLLVLDEGHKIKNEETHVSQAVRKIHAECRLILTGTPLANNLVELYSLLSFLASDVFTTSKPFAEAFDLSTNTVDPAKLQLANGLLHVFMIRRMKETVEKLMPKKVETKIVCPLSKMQMWWYKAVLVKDLDLLCQAEQASKTKAKLLNNLVMQLRKVCLHPFLFDGAEDGDTDNTTLEQLVGASGKLAVLDQLLRSLYKKGHRVVLFSQFVRVLHIVEDYCLMRGWKYCRFDGSNSRAQRNFKIKSFAEEGSDRFLFLMSTRSGGLGINLQAADTCILFDSDWNPQPDLQGMFLFLGNLFNSLQLSLFLLIYSYGSCS